MKILIIDTIGLVYNGFTLNTKGLGGSESAIILLSKELAKLGMDVDIICRCDAVGTYNNVNYYDLSQLPLLQDNKYDVLISSRSTLPFMLNQMYYTRLVDNAKYRVLWMHDTFCQGDENLQGLLLDKRIDRVFTLSDWHTIYVTTANHGCFRYHEFMKSKIFVTRNGIVNYIENVDLSKKNKNKFVYNASISKGMYPLLENVWPEVKTLIPDATLTIIGGYYDFEDPDPNSFKNQFTRLMHKYNNTNGITFTGIIKQSEIATILADSTFFLYPSIYPETFGISVTEALNYNTLLVGFNFGALEETAPSATSYQAEYIYDANTSAHHALLEQVQMAYYDDYLRQQKQYKCNEYKPYLGWDIVALQWKHHFYRQLGLYLPRNETIKHRESISNINRLFNKRIVNNDEHYEHYIGNDNNQIVVISPCYNAENYIQNCILSVASQVYDNYLHYIIDDASTDNTLQVIYDTINALPSDIKEKFKVISNEKRTSAVYNQVSVINDLLYNNINISTLDTVFALLDGDDSLVNDPDIFMYIDKLYTNGAKFTYGSCHSMADNIDLIAQPYPLDVKKNKTFRQHLFNWGLPYTHLRTFTGEVYDAVDQSVFKDSDGNYWKAGGDNAFFYPLIEQCKPNEIVCVQRVLVNYNDINPLNDYKVNGTEQNKTADTMRNMPCVNIDINDNVQKRLFELAKLRALPVEHINYLKLLKEKGVYPKIIYDIGSNVLYWRNEAIEIWKDAEVICFEAMQSVKQLYDYSNVKNYHLGVLSNEDGKVVDFYQNEFFPGGNSYYKENSEVYIYADNFFNESNKITTHTKTLQTIVKENNYPIPDLIKMDVQGAEYDIIIGSEELFKKVKHIILELQTVEYNKGAPLKDFVIEYMHSIGFEPVDMMHSNGPDADYYFINKNI